MVSACLLMNSRNDYPAEPDPQHYNGHRMPSTLISVIVVAPVSLCSLSEAAKGVTMGYETGTSYLKLPDNLRGMWMVGAIDRIIAETFENSGKKAAAGTWLGDCIAGHEVMQIKAVFEKELNRQPESWQA